MELTLDFVRAFSPLVASAVALYIAWFIYPWQKEKDRELKIEEEKRKALSGLVFEIETFMAKAKTSMSVKIREVPDFTEEKVSVQRAVSLVKTYGSVEVIEMAVSYEKVIRRLVLHLVKEKSLRPPERSDERFRRTQEYIEAQDRSSDLFREMVSAREEFFKAVGGELGVSFPAEHLD